MNFNIYVLALYVLTFVYRFKSNHYTLYSMQNEIIWFVNHSTFCNCLRVSDDYQVFRPDKSNEEHSWQNLKKIFHCMHFLNRSQWKTVFLFNDGNAYLQTRRISVGINSLTTRRSVFANVQEHECLNICKISLSRKSIFWWIKSNEC